MIESSLITTILLISRDASTAEWIRQTLIPTLSTSYDLEWAAQLPQALMILSRRDIAAVILELPSLDIRGMEIFEKLFSAIPGIPILVLGEDPDGIGMHAIAAGAQDYLGSADHDALPRALRHAIERKLIEDALYLEKERALVTLNSIGDAVLCTDREGNVTYLNLVAQTMTGWSLKDATGQPLGEVFHIIEGSTRQVSRNPLDMAVQQNRTVGLTENCILIRRDGFESAIEDSASPIHDRAGRIIGAVIVFHDVSAARAMSKKMTHFAQHDFVTDLPNRLLLNDRICQAISLASRQTRPIAVIFLDLDHFKHINDSLGHAVGDRLLQSVSRRLVGCMRSSDTVCRQGGDEFIILLTDLDAPEDAATAAKRILRELGRPHSIGDLTLHINASLGIGIYPQDGKDPETLIKNADAAMYHTKETGRNNFRFFKPEMNQKAVERQSLESNLRVALEREEFLLHYQPKINLVRGHITGAEALIRWRQPDRGLVAPGRFVPVAEECGLIVPIGRWALREACRQTRAWQDVGLALLPIAVNVSALEFREEGFIEGVSETLADTGLEPHFLELELTERVLMKDVETTAAVLSELKKMGVRLALDDFGTGYSSLSYLQTFPMDVLKIDRSFVHRIHTDPDDSLIVKAIIDMAKILKLGVVAEGIETPGQLAYLQSHQCGEGQGYLFSRPVASEQFIDLLRMGIPWQSNPEPLPVQ